MARQAARKSGFDFLRPEDVYSDDGDSDGRDPLGDRQAVDRPRQTARRSGINSSYDSDHDDCADEDDVMDPSEASEEGDSDADHDDPAYVCRSSKTHAKNDRVWKDAVWAALQGKVPDSSIACGGRVQKLPFACPALSVEGVGRIALPLCPEQAATLKAVAQQVAGSPGLEAVHQVDGTKVSTGGEQWQQALSRTLAAAAPALGLGSATAARLQPMLQLVLLAEAGSALGLAGSSASPPGSGQQQASSSGGTFCTLVVQLPCCGGHEGGKVVVRHQGRCHEQELAEASSSEEVAYVALMAGCEVQAGPVIKGRQLALVYSLGWPGPGPAPQLLAGGAASALQCAVLEWEARLAAGQCQSIRLAFELEHKYFEDDEQLSFARLKGGDKQLAQLAAACPLLDVHLARLTKVVRGVCHESSGGGGAAGGGYSGRKRSWQECYGQECYGQDEEGSEGSGSEGSGSEEEEGFRKMQDVQDVKYGTSQWVDPAGWGLQYGSLHPLKDVFRAQGQAALFPDDEDDTAEPDEEEVEPPMGYYIGSSLTHTFHRALLVLWPRSQALANASKAGLPTLLTLLKHKIGSASSSSRSHSSSTVRPAQQAAQAEAQAVLEAVVAYVDKPPEVRVRISSRLWVPGGPRYTSEPVKLGDDVIRALQLASQAAEAKVPGAQEAAARLVHALAGSEGVGSQWVAEALVQAAVAPGGGAVAAALQGLVASRAGTHLQQCVTLLQAAGPHPALQVSIATALTDALLADGPSAKEAFARQPEEYLVQLSDVLLGSAELRSGPGEVYRRFAEVCVQREHSGALLKALLQSPAVQLCKGLGAVQRLARARLSQVQGSGAGGGGRRPFSWCMPEASIPGCAELQDFLRGPEETKTFTGRWKAGYQASGWVSEHLGRGSGRNNSKHVSGTYSVVAEQGGRAAQSYVVVTKTKEWHQQQGRAQREVQQEAKVLKQMLGIK